MVSPAHPLTLAPIATIESDFPSKFGIPRQSGLVAELEARVVFLPEYRHEEALRGLEGFSHLWLIWGFSEAFREGWASTVRPPRLGGNVRMGVFATRSPFRPNPLGLSSVKLLGMEREARRGTVLVVSGADLMNGTPIYDVKPYVPHTDSHPDALGGFSEGVRAYGLQVVFPPELLALIPAEKQAALLGVLRQDPRPSYQNDPDRLYGFPFAGYEIKFTVEKSILIVRRVELIVL